MLADGPQRDGMHEARHSYQYQNMAKQTVFFRKCGLQHVKRDVAPSEPVEL